MFDHFDDAVEQVVRHLRRPVSIDPALDKRVMEEIAALPAPRPARSVWRWLTERRAIRLSPLGALGMAATLAAVMITAWRMRGTAGSTPIGGVPGFQFVLVEPRAAKVFLVGDFNDWDSTRTPMRRASGEGLWTAVVRLTPGRYRYAFLIDGHRWLADPSAPAASDDGYGAPSSVVTVGGS